jgi:hypothetical protein
MGVQQDTGNRSNILFGKLTKFLIFTAVPSLTSPSSKLEEEVKIANINML